MQVVQLIEGDEGYGVAAVLRIILGRFPDMRVVALGQGKLVDEFQPERVLWRGSGSPPSIRKRSTIGILGEMAATLRRWWHDAGSIAKALGPGDVILHCHNQYTVLVAAMVRARRRGSATRIVFHFHSKMTQRLWGAIQAIQVQLFGRIADTIVCVSEAVSKYWRGSRCPIVVLHNAITPHASAQENEPVQWRRDRNVLLIAASLSAEKGHLIAVDALASLRKQGCDAELWIAGGPIDENVNPFARVLRERIQSLELTDRVRLLGLVPNVRALARQAWVGLQLRITPEPCSMWVLESLDAGLPMVASNTGGTPELIRDGIDGLLVEPPVSAEDVSAAVLRLMRDEKLHQRMSENSRNRASVFSIAAFTEGLSRVYTSLGHDEASLFRRSAVLSDRVL